MFWRFVSSAMRLRARRLSLAFVALGVAAALATALFSVYSDVERRVSDEFASYGANLIVASRGAKPTVPVAAAQRARAAGATAAAPFLFTTGTLNGEPVSVAQMDVTAAEDLTRFWHVEGARGDCMLGTNLAQRVHLKIEDLSGTCRVAGIVTTGGPEDNEMIVPFGAGGTASLVQVRAPAAQLDAVEASLHREFPDAEIRQVRAAAATERSVVTKIRVTLFLLLALILTITTMSVTSNFSELVMERRGEIGILKAIGAGEPKIASLFVTESLLLALAAALTGYACGILLAGWIGQSVFHTSFAVHVYFPVLLLATALTLTVALAATALSASSIWRVQPARILRGE